MTKTVFFPLLKKEILELLRSFFGLSSAVMARYMPEFVKLMGVEMPIVMPDPVFTDVVAQFIKNTSQVITIALIFLCMGIVATEKSRKTAVFVLVKPVSRVQFILAKTAAYWLAVFVCHTVSALLCYLYAWLLFGEMPPGPFAAMYGILVLFLLFLVTMITFFSTILNYSMPAAALSFFSWFLISGLSASKTFGQFSPVALVGQAEAVFSGQALQWQPITGAAVLIVCFLVGGILIFRKWEP